MPRKKQKEEFESQDLYHHHDLKLKIVPNLVAKVSLSIVIIFVIIFIILILGLVGLRLIRKGTRLSYIPQPPTINKTYSPKGNTPLSVGTNKTSFGVMLGAPGMSISKRTEIAKELGATYFRTNTIRLQSWNGKCEECDAALNAGLKPLPSISNSGGSRQPSSPPSNIKEYKSKLSQILDAYPIEIVVVENEENSQLFYTGTPSEYGQELKAACEVAHQKGRKCTNGGLVSALTALLVYSDYKEKGEIAKANDFAARVFSLQERRLLNTQKAAEQIQKGKELIKEYRNSGADFVNFHWYIDDVNALEEAVNFLRKETGLPVITNEVGQQKNENPEQVTKTLQKLTSLKVPLVIWFSIDTPALGQARALINPDGSLRPNGEAFKNFVQSYQK